MQDEGARASHSQPLASQKLTKDQEEQVKGLLAQFKADSSPLAHILTLYSYFFSKFTEERTKLESEVQSLEKSLKEAESPKEGEKEDEAAARLKEQEDTKKRLELGRAAVGQKAEFLRDIRRFFGSEQISLLVQQISKVLALIQHSNMELAEQVKGIVNCVFDCFMPEVHDEVVSVAKAKESKLRKQGKKEGPPDSVEEESKYVSMEPIRKISTGTEQQASVDNARAVEDGSHHKAGSSQALTSSATKSKARPAHLSIFRDVDTASSRLSDFSTFCLQNKLILNKLVKNMYSQSSRERESSSKDIGTISEYIKFMPHLLDFENKRMYFKKEIKKLRRAGYSNLTLYIRRSEIFMDAYS